MKNSDYEINSFELIKLYRAGVVELVDAEDSKSSGRKSVRVRVSPPAPIKGLAVLRLLNL